MKIKNLMGRGRQHLFFIPFIILVSSLCHFNCGSREALEILVYPPEYLISGTETALRVIVLERKTDQPLAGAQVTIRLKKEKTNRQELLFKGKTGPYGSPHITFNVPTGLEGDCKLIAEAQSELGSGKVSIPVTVKKGFKILLTSDKAVYRPGQTIHMRGVVFENSKPASRQAVSIEVIEPSGYSVFEKTVNTCNYGIAEADFTLGDEINTGDYTLRFFIGTDKEEKRVHVTDLPPPGFSLACFTEKTRYVPGQQMKGKIKATDLYGKPLTRAKTRVTLYKNQKEKSKKITGFQGVTDAGGTFEFSYKIPSPKNALDSKKSSAPMYQLVLEAAVQHTDRVETITQRIPAASYPMDIQPVPGRGAPEIDKSKKASIILRTDRSVYNKGETPELTISSIHQEGFVYVDVLKENQIILTTELQMEAGKAQVKLPIADKHTGTLTCYARIIPVPGQKSGAVLPVLSEQRKIFVIPAKDEEIEITFHTSKKTYFSGDEANIDIFTRRQGKVCRAALGITIVDDTTGSALAAGEDFLLPLLYHTKKADDPGSIQPNYSPRILYSNPRLMTDEDGRASFIVRIEEVESPPVSRWQALVLAHTLDMVMGSETHNLPVNYGPFVDMVLPPELTQEDEITIPVTIHNHQPSSQEVLLQLREGDWFELSGLATRKAVLKAHDKKVEYFKIRVTGCGDNQMRLDTRVPSSGREDTLTQELTIRPLGRLVQQAFNYNLNGNGEIHKQLLIPETASNACCNTELKILPVFITQVSDSFQGMLRMPYGCFEQSSSFTYPNIMILDYMQRTGQDTPEIKEKAEKYISDGYQKLLQFEAKEGGFSFFRVAGAPYKIFTLFRRNAQKILTAYGLMLFADMEKVYKIDNAIIRRVQNWLISQMNGDHWGADSHFGATSSARDNDFAATAYITWTLLYSGLDRNNKGIKKAIDYLEENYKSYADNPNALSYCALSMIKAKKDAAPIMKLLNRLAIKEDQDEIYWTPGLQGQGTGAGSFNSIANVETTAVAALANLEAKNNSFNIVKIIHYLLKHKSALGNWGSTQATVLTLKVLIESLPQWSKPISGTVQVWMDNNHVKDINFTEENNQSKQVVDLKDFIGKGNRELRINHQVKGELFCQLILSYYVRWDEALTPKIQPPINLSLNYNTRRLNKGESITVDATASYKDKGVVPFVIVDIGIPPGFEVNPADFSQLIAKGIIERFEIDRGRIILYLNDLEQRGFRFGLKALAEGRVKMPASRIYDYYNPQVFHVAQPVELTVTNR